MTSREVLRSPHDGGGLPLPDNRQNPEYLRIFGDLTEFLQNDFLGRAANANIMSLHDADTIPLLVNDVLVSLMAQNGSEQDHPEFIAISSVPRTIARKISKGSVFEGSWEYYGHLRDMMMGLAQSEDEKLRKFAESFTELSVDLDVKIDGLSEKTSLTTLADRVARLCGVEQLQSGETRDYRLTLPKYPEYTLEVLATESPTSAIDILKIYFRNQEDTELFHIDITKAGVYPDKRAAITTYIQDTCTAKLDNAGGKIQYSITKEAIDALDKQDIFDAEVKSSGALVEIFLRGLRQSLLPPKHQVILANGEALTLPRFDMLLPLFRSAVSRERPSLFGLRRTMVDLMKRGEMRLPKKEAQVRLLEKVLFDCLTFDPYTTIQALRDSGIALAIPGLRKYSYEDWNNILRSPALILGPLMNGTAYPRMAERTFADMALERDRYIGLHGSPRRYDGFERFMRALGSDRGREWSDYLGLWEEAVVVSKKKVTVSRRTLPAQFSALELQDEKGDLYRISKINGTMDTAEADHVQALLEGQLPRNWRKRMKDAMVSINGNSHDQRISRMYKKMHGFTEGKSENQKILRSISSVAAIMQLAPFGLTAQELKYVYDSADSGSLVLPFDDAFYWLKLTGSVVRNVEPRVNKTGEIKPTSIYIWQDPRNKTRLIRITEDEVHMLAPEEVTINSFIRSGIYTAEVLLALTEQDIQFLKKEEARFFLGNLGVAQKYIQDWLDRQQVE